MANGFPFGWKMLGGYGTTRASILYTLRCLPPNNTHGGMCERIQGRDLVFHLIALAPKENSVQTLASSAARQGVRCWPSAPRKTATHISMALGPNGHQRKSKVAFHLSDWKNAADLPPIPSKKIENPSSFS